MSDEIEALRARADAAEAQLAEVKAEARSWQSLAEANQATAESHVERWAEAESIIIDLIGSTNMPWSEAVGRAESFLYARAALKDAQEGRGDE